MSTPWKPQQVTLREITPADDSLIVRWRNENDRWFPVQPPFTLEMHQSWYWYTYLTDPSQNLYMVLADGQRIGIVGMTIRDGKGELERMILGDKAYARGGYMRQGMRQLMDAYGLEHYWLRVMPDNEVTIAFHERNGFKITNTHGGEYINTLGETGQYLIMERYGEEPWNLNEKQP